MAATRSMRKGSVTGFTLAANTTNASKLATAGRRKWFLRGKISSTIPRLPVQEISAKSPVRGVRPSFRKWPRARQVTTPASVCTS